MFIRVNQCLKNEIGPFVPSCPHKGPWGLSGYESIMQRPKGVLSEVEGNKPNFKMGNINISTARTKPYDNKQRTMNNKRHSKQTQSNPILSRRSPERSRIPPPPSCAGKESRISERNAYPDLSGQHQRSRIQYRESSIFPILPRNHGVIAQNKPKSRKAKTNATPYAANDYENNARPAARKNKPNKS